MRVFRHWSREWREGLLEGHRIAGFVHGGSDISPEAARADLESRWKRVLDKGTRCPGRTADDYEADVREELIERPLPEVAITRNRYGASILNCKGPVFVDIDWCPRRLMEHFFGRRKLSDDERAHRVLRFLHPVVSNRRKGVSGARVYLTPKGMRAVIECGSSDPRSPQVQAAMREVQTDDLYSRLCEKQNCYRVRLTAKPSRIGLRSLNQPWPTDAGGLQARSTWVAAYVAKAAGFASCRYLETLGQVPDHATIELHDHLSGAHSGRPLA